MIEALIGIGAFALGYLIGGTRAHIANQRYLDQVDEQMRKYRE